MSDDLATKLLALRYDALLSIAKAKGIDVSADSSKRYIVDKLLGNWGDELKNSCSHVLELELTSALRDIESRMSQKLESLECRHAKEIRSIEKEAGSYKNIKDITQFLLGFIALILSIVGFIGYKFVDAYKTISQTQAELDASLSAVKVINASMDETSKRHGDDLALLAQAYLPLVIDKIRDDCFYFVEGMTPSGDTKAEKILVDHISNNKKVIRDLQKIYVQVERVNDIRTSNSLKTNDPGALSRIARIQMDQRVLGYLAVLCDVLIHLASIDMDAGNPMREHQLDECIAIFSSIYPNPNEFKEDYWFSAFSKDLKALCKGAGALVHLRKYRYLTPRINESLDRAVFDLLEAIKISDKFAGLYRNLGVCLSQRYSQRENILTTSQLDELVADTLGYYDKATNRTTDKTEISVICNNQSFILLKHSFMYAKRGKTEAALKFQKEAERMIGEIDKIPVQQVHPIAHTTKAEILCLGVELSKDAIQGKSSEWKQEKFQEVLSTVKRAIDGGFDGYAKYTKDVFFKDIPVYRSLGYLKEDYEAELLATVGIRTDAPQ